MMYCERVDIKGIRVRGLEWWWRVGGRECIYAPPRSWPIVRRRLILIVHGSRPLLTSTTKKANEARILLEVWMSFEVSVDCSFNRLLFKSSQLLAGLLDVYFKFIIMVDSSFDHPCMGCDERQNWHLPVACTQQLRFNIRPVRPYPDPIDSHALSLMRRNPLDFKELKARVLGLSEVDRIHYFLYAQ
jgi:hypothetical protein